MAFPDDEPAEWGTGPTSEAIRRSNPLIAPTPDEVMSREMPKEVSDWYEKLKVTGTFTITPHRATDDGFVLLPVIKNRIPTMEEIGRIHGPGKYRLSVEFRPSSWTKGSKTEDGPWFELGETGFAEMHEDYKEGRRRKNTPETTSGAVDPFAGIRVLGPVLQSVVGAMRGQPAAAPAGGMDSAVLVALITSMNQQSQNMMAMMQKSNQDTMALMMKMFENRQPQNNPDTTMDRVLSMVEKSMQIKNALTGQEPEEKETMLDRLMGAAAQLLPHIGQMLSNLKATPAIARPYVVQAALSQQPPELQQGVRMMKDDSGFRAAAYAKLRAEFGPGAEEIIQVMEMAGVTPEAAPVEQPAPGLDPAMQVG